MSGEDTTELAAMQEVLRKSLACQHEAMRRALLLHKRNVELEKSARDKDAGAVALEVKCNSALREGARKMLQQQEQLEALLVCVTALEKKTLQQIADNEELARQLKRSRKDRQRLQEVLDQRHQEKKQLVQELSRHAAERHDLEMQIDRLVGENASLKTRVTELDASCLLFGMERSTAT